MKFLSENGIMSKVYFDPVHKTPFYKKLGYSKDKLPITEKISEQILSLPMFPGMNKNELQLIVDTIDQFLKKESPNERKKLEKM